MKNIFIVFCILAHTFGWASFSSPSKKQLEITPIEQISWLVPKFVNHDTYIQEITEKETTGFIGYRGDSIEFMIYQDIIRLIIENIVGIPIREDFHFLAVPLDPQLKIQTKSELAETLKGKQPQVDLFNTTFPLNFSIYDNANRLGLNTLQNFIQNQSVKPLGYKKRLIWLFNQLGIDQNEIEKLFETAYSKLTPEKGVILQIFGDPDYSFSKKIAYPAYSNGFISSNVTIDEYFLDDAFIPPYPHEVRLMLTNKETLNPNSPLKIVRYFQEDLTSYEELMKEKIQSLAFKKKKRLAYRSELLKVWE